MNIAIYGGTFDPPHIGHINACKNLIGKLNIDKLYVIPTFIPPHKQRTSDVSAEIRYEMCKIAFADISDKIEISDVEMKRQGKSYTADTIRFFKEKGNELIYFLCGTDMLLTLDTWYNPEYIFTNAEIVCMRREEDPSILLEIEKKVQFYKERFNAKVHFLYAEPIKLSSSEIRSIEVRDQIRPYVSEKVFEFICEKGLYGKV